MDTSDKVIAILQASNDGNKLRPSDLSLCQAGVNRNLTERGMKMLDSLYESVTQGRYESEGRHWHFGVENMTKSHSGYILWKGTVVEHYSHHYADDERRDVEKLAAHCRMLESKGFPVNMRTATNPEMYAEAPADTPWLNAMLHYYTIFADKNGKATWCVLGMEGGAAAIRMVDGQPEVRYVAEDNASSGCYTMFHLLQNAGFESCSDRARSYAKFVQLMEESGIAPEQIDAVLAAPFPAPAESPAPAP